MQDFSFGNSKQKTKPLATRGFSAGLPAAVLIVVPVCSLNFLHRHFPPKWNILIKKFLFI
jgi:hypothetical protein